MNLNFTSFPLIEKILVYGGIFISSVFIVILSSFLNKEKLSVKTGGLFQWVALFFLFFTNIFLFLYLKAPVEYVAGIEIKQIYLFFLLVLYVCLLFSCGIFKTGYEYILFFIYIICIQLIFLNSSIFVIALFFVLFNVALSVLTGRINNKQYFYILFLLIFLGVYLIEEKTKILSIGINGILVFSLLSAFPSFWVLNVHEIPDNNKNDNLLLMILQVSFIVFFKLIEFYNSFSPANYSLFFISFVLLLFSVFNFLTEEDIFRFFVSDFINIFFLIAFIFSILILNNIDMLAVFTAMALAAVFLNSFFLDIQKKYSVSYVRYNFGKIKGSGHLLISVLLTLFVEIYLVFRLIQNFNYFIPYIQTVILIAGFIYMICIINKIFIIFSMVLRIKIDNLKYILFNKTITRPILFVLFILCLSLWWIKNG